QGQGALGAKHYDEAVKTFGDALKLQPGDAEATKALHNATTLRDAVKTPSQPMIPARGYSKQMQAGARREQQQKYPEAVLALTEALRLMPGDAKATTGLHNAEFAQHVGAAHTAHAAKRFAEAISEYEEALRLQPGNADVTAALKRAKEGKP